MSFLRLLWSGGKTAALALACWLVLFRAALAAHEPAQPPVKDTGSSVYVWCYIIVILGIALGMMIVCHSSNRRDRARPEHYDETKSKLLEE